MAELGSTGGNLDNILQYLLQRIERIAGGVTEGVARFADLSDVPAPTSGKTQYWGWTGSAYAWLNAPEGGGEDYYTKTQVNDLLKDYAKTSALPDMTEYVLLETYNKGIADVKAWATSEADSAAAAAQGNAIANAKAYTDSKASETLNAANANAATIIEQALEGYATNSALNTAINGANTTAQDYANTALANAKSYADGKFVTLNTEQEITAAKKFISMFDFFGTNSDGIYFYNHDSNGVLIGHYTQNYYGDASYLQFRNGEWKGYVQFMTGIYGNVNVRNGGIEIFDTTPYIDFHYENSTADFTSRIIESSSGVIELLSNSNGVGTLKIGNAYLTYDSDNNALFVKGANGSAINLVATGDVAAFSGLGSGFDTLTDLTLTNSLNINGSYLRGLVTTIRNVNYYGLNVADQPLVIGTPQLPVHLHSYKDYGLLAYKKARFSEKVEFVSDIDITTLRINSELYVNPNDTSAKIYIGGTKANYAVEKMFADGTNVYITINGKQYKLANA